MAGRYPQLPQGSNDPLEVRELCELQARGIKKVRLVSEGQYRASLRLAVSKASVELLGDLELPQEILDLIRQRALEEISRSSSYPGSAPVEESEESQQSYIPNSSAPPPTTIDKVSQVLSADWRSEIDDVRNTQRQQIERLESRIEDLMQALKATDQLLLGLSEIPTASSQEAQADLANSGVLMGKKSELLEQLFQANLVLRELESGNSAALKAGSGEEN